MHFHWLTGFFGFISGFLLLITGNTLNYWIAKDGIDLKVIGLFSLVSLPYAINFFWAPLLDRIKLKVLGNKFNSRLKWLLIFHLIGASLTAYLSQFDPSDSSKLIASLAFILSFINASQDLILNALRAELIPSKLKASTSGTYIFGYRVGMFLSGPIAIYISQFFSWQQIYFIFSLIYFLFPLIFLLVRNNLSIPQNNKQSIYDVSNFKDILQEIAPLKTISLILLFLIFYRLADNFIGVMLNPFLISQGYTEAQISIAGKLCGLVGAGFGGLIAAKIMAKKTITHCLKLFAIIHAVSHASYISIAYLGNNTYALLFSTFAESITSGMTMAAYIGLITKLCNGKYTATQYGLFSAMMGVSRTILPSFAGFIVANTSWILFFIISVIMVIPSLLILKILERQLPERIND